MASNTQVIPSSAAAGQVVQKNARKLKLRSPPEFTDKEEERKYKLGKLAAAFRIFAQRGFDEGIAGHLTLRDPILKDHFWVNPFGRAFSQMTVSDLLLISPQGEIVMGGKPDRQVYNEAAYAIHHAVHSARPDVEAACHSHSVYGRAFSTLGIDLDITTQDACAFFNDLAVYRGFGGAVLDSDEGDNIAKALGQKKAVILQNHGLLTTGTSIEAAVWWFINLESLCRIQLLADAAAGGRQIKTIKAGEKEAEFTYKVIGSHLIGWAQAQPYFDQIHERSNGAYLQ
ncbi:hypothetical protein MJO28_005119 [Puccinia striiformis f. sp. tritici]|uniref:Class II aldolase/adducin N-terminal domain-containing protein n=2 Tax=Puccinia striiformis f. sp. tritici TaxID=168172 RepID=A0A0L0VCU9_9BASI|nr:hypothetical protein Pst134EA_009292 [Puccinia striiformis f. sp. tritici]KAI9622405.1 hypothetical protein KEM48_007296 [Puccinia striiformis f. sp. tritici PST-130]KNE97021.1 hypothetical protein PSTG_09757 [Puccinia striiformis f. sp. tritici PST-78]KAH9458064.1 hypothetical protein Pst134EB_010367 [Puccinia striiformis f. sp. tritici]KAH9468760.1 hypothetical protein Pst134EA_009292 [Puccinia striiformis f. sp. tritici]KAI7954719.1 hypothetical protein MJO28_005119 [Puccinia striiformis